MRGTKAKQLRKLAAVGSTAETPQVAYMRKDHDPKPVVTNGRVIMVTPFQVRLADSIRRRYVHLKKLYKDQ